MAILGPVVEAFVRTMFDARSDLAFGCAIGTKLVGDKAFRHKTVSLHQSVKQSFCRLLVAPALEDFIQYNPILINCWPNRKVCS